MRKIIGFLSNSKAVGMDTAEAFLFDDNATDEEINKTVWQAAVQHAENFFEVVEDYDEDSEDEDFNDNHYLLLEEVESYWEDYNGDDHDGQRVGGGSFEQDFA